MFINKVDFNDIHGKSFIFHIGKIKNQSNVDEEYKKEKESGLHCIQTYVQYSKNCSDIVDVFRNDIIIRKSRGRKIISYGASAKGISC